jgi:hypothetical protein
MHMLGWQLSLYTGGDSTVAYSQIVRAHLKNYQFLRQTVQLKMHLGCGAKARNRQETISGLDSCSVVMQHGIDGDMKYRKAQKVWREAGLNLRVRQSSWARGPQSGLQLSQGSNQLHHCRLM